MNSDFSIDDFIKTEEPSAEYMKGGYCPINIGDTLIGQYFIVRKLGWGYTSTVWLCWNMMSKSFVAIKIMKNASTFIDIITNEIYLLEIVNEAIENDYSNHVVKMLDHFECETPHGTHCCLVFELAGEILYEFQLKYDLDGTFIKSIVRQILKGLFYLHEHCGLIHTDLKPDNILVFVDGKHDGKTLALETYNALNTTNVPKSFTSNLPSDHRLFKIPTNETEKIFFEQNVKKFHKFLQEEMERLKIIPLKTCLDKEKKNLSQINQSSTSGVSSEPGDFVFFKTNEKDFIDVAGVQNPIIKLGDLGYAIQVENSALEKIIQNREYRAVEIILGIDVGKPVDIWSVACITVELITGEPLFPSELTDEEHLATITQLFGDIPHHVLEKSKHKTNFYDSEGKLLHIKLKRPLKLSTVLVNEKFSNTETEELLDLLLSMFKWDPDKRLTVEKCLQHSWLQTTHH